MGYTGVLDEYEPLGKIEDEVEEDKNTQVGKKTPSGRK